MVDEEYRMAVLYGATELSQLLIIKGDTLINIKRPHIVTYVEIPDTVRVIAPLVFRCDHKIETVVIPSSVEEIGISAFFSCTALKRVFIPRSVKVMEDSVFHECDPELEIFLEGEPQEGWFVGNKEKKIVEDRIITDEDDAFNFHRSSGSWNDTTVKKEVEINHHWNADNAKVHCNVSKDEFLRLLTADKLK